MWVAHGGGCPHMTCTCGADFCYDCGHRYKTLGIVSHKKYKTIPFISCPKMWKSKPKRIATHAAVGTSIVIFSVPVFALVAPIAAVVVPSVMIAKAFKKRRRRRRFERQRQLMVAHESIDPLQQRILVDELDFQSGQPIRRFNLSEHDVNINSDEEQSELVF